MLTSSENLKRIEEKEKEKQRKAQEKEERAKKDKQRTAEGKDSCWSEVSSKRKVNSHAKAFTDAELIKFAKAYEEGYDITTNARYNLWLETFHQEHSKSGIKRMHYASPHERQTLLNHKHNYIIMTQDMTTDAISCTGKGSSSLAIG